MQVTIKSECFFIFCWEESLITEANSPGVSKFKAWRRLKKLYLLNYCQSSVSIFLNTRFGFEVANTTLLYDIK